MTGELPVGHDGASNAGGLCVTDDERRVLRACQAALLQLIEEATMRLDQNIATEDEASPRGRWLRDVAASFDRLTVELGVKI